MTSNSEEDSSSEASFGWVDAEDKNTDGEKINVHAGVMSSDSEEDSDATEFEDGDNGNAANSLQRQQLHVSPRSMVAQSDRLDLRRNENSIGSLADNSQLEEDFSDEEVENDEEDEKLLKPFTKNLIVKKERYSHTLSDDENVDSHATRRSTRVKPESHRAVHEQTNINKSSVLIKDAVIDSSQPLKFDIGADEDVWIVQCPREISESSLKGKTISFNGASHIANFESNVLPTPEMDPLNLLLPKVPGNLINFIPKGHIVIKEKETMLQDIHPLHREENIVSLPTGLKLRHPLFGTELPLLKSPLVTPLAKKKKKRTKHLNKSIEDEYNVTENRMSGAEDIVDVNSHLNSLPIHIKAKNKKKHRESFNEVEKDVLLRNYDGINNTSPPKMKKFITDSFDISGSLAETSAMSNSEKVKKKKKKHKYEKECESECTKPMLNQAPNDEDYEYSTSLLTQRLHESADDPLDVPSSDILKKKKKKKKIKQENNELTDFSTEIADDTFVPSHRKSKKIKVENMTDDNLHSLDHDMEEVSIKKHKKISSSHTTADNSTHMFNSNILNCEAEYFGESVIKKKKKRKRKISE